jgi:hypothetical protein
MHRVFNKIGEVYRKRDHAMHHAKPMLCAVCKLSNSVLMGSGTGNG